MLPACFMLLKEMMRKTFFVLLSLLAGCLPLWAEVDSSKVRAGGLITVTGTSRMEVVPDEVHLFVTIREYYEEELEGNTDPKTFKTKVDLSAIDEKLSSAFSELKLSKKSISTYNVGSRWRDVGQEFLKSKQYDLLFRSLMEAERVADALTVKGIESLYIGNLSSRNLPLMREKSKVEALQAARRKANALVKALDRKLGEVVEIIEPEEQGYDVVLDEESNLAAYNAKSAMAEGASQRLRTIVLYNTVRVTFRIEE